MEQILQSLEENIILNDEIVLDLKHEIQRSYPSADTKFRAKLLADSLHSRLDENLVGLKDEVRSQVRVSIFKNSISENRLTVSQMDLVNEVVHSEMKPRDLYLYMNEWFSSYTDEKIEYEQIHLMLSEIKPDLKTKDVFPTQNSHLEKTLGHSDNVSVDSSRNFKEIITNITISLKNNYYKPAIILLSLFLILPVVFLTHHFLENQPISHSMSFVHASSVVMYTPQLEIDKASIVKKIFYRETPGYPDFLEFIELDYTHVVSYLHSRNSSFTDEDYLNIIYAVGEEYDVHPLLLLAIIGQEQGFVPKDSPYATRILNNPFNVYTSWTNYNTNLRDSCEVAAGTIRIILSERPAGENPFRWLNTRYAEDPNWWKGVQELFYTLLAHIE